MTDFDTAGSRLTLITRAECGLCEDAERDLRRLGVQFDLVDVDEDPGLVQLYNDWVPVLLLDGEELARAPLNERTLQTAADLARRAQ